MSGKDETFTLAPALTMSDKERAELADLLQEILKAIVASGGLNGDKFDALTDKINAFRARAKL